MAIDLTSNFMIANIRVLSGTSMLLYCHNNEHDVYTYYELNIKDWTKPLITSVDATVVSGENEFNFISTPLPVSEFAVPAIPYEVEKDLNVHIASSDTTYATFAVGIDNIHKNISKIMGYTRSLDHIRTVASMVGDTVTDNGDQVWKDEELYNNANGLRKVVKVKTKSDL